MNARAGATSGSVVRFEKEAHKFSSVPSNQFGLNVPIAAVHKAAPEIGLLRGSGPWKNEDDHVLPGISRIFAARQSTEVKFFEPHINGVSMRHPLPDGCAILPMEGSKTLCKHSKLPGININQNTAPQDICYCGSWEFLFPFWRSSFYSEAAVNLTMLVNPGIRSVLLTGSALALCLLSASCNRSAIPDTTAVFGKVVTAAGVDSSNSPTALADVFSPQQKTVYVVAEAKHVAAGTHLTANWSREGTVIQVSNEVVAAQEYRDANIEFHMNPGADGWIPGAYKVQIIANGQPGPGAGFTIK